MVDELKTDEGQFEAETRKQYTEVFQKEEKNLSREELERRILKFLGTKVIGTLATSYNDEPRSTPVRYCNDGWNILILTEGGGKTHNIARNPRVCFSVYGNYSGFRSVRGLQLWGQAEIIQPDDGELYQSAFETMKLRERDDLKKIGAENTKPVMPIIRIKPTRARYLSVPEGILNRELHFEMEEK